MDKKPKDPGNISKEPDLDTPGPYVSYDPASEARLKALQASMKEQDAARASFIAGLTPTLRAALHRAQSKNNWNEYQDALNDWIDKDANMEALAEWLSKDGWHKVDTAEVEKRLVAAACAIAITVGKPGSPVIFEAVKPEDYDHDFSRWVLFFDVPDAERNTQAVEDRRWTCRYTDPCPLPRCGLDALRYAIERQMFGGHSVLRYCLPHNIDSDPAVDWLSPLVAPWLGERVEKEKERLQRAALAVGIDIREKARTEAGNEWTPIPRALHVAAALGGPFNVDVNGETYASEPGLAGAAVGRALRPRGLDIVPAKWLGKPAQLNLALDLRAPSDALREYMVYTATRTAHLAQLPCMVPKMLGYMFAAAPMTGTPVKGTLLDHHHVLNPKWKSRRQNKRDLQGLGAAFVAVKDLRLVETKPDGTRHPYELFIVDYDLSCQPDAEVGFMVNPWLVERMKRGKGGGYFLVNMTRWLALDIQNPRLFPLALRVAALWDKARVGGIYDPAHLQPIEADRLTWECNTLPEGAAAYRFKRTDTESNKVQLKRARAKLESDLDELREAGLLGQYKTRKVHGEGFNVLPVPPADYAEACKRAVHAARTRKPGRPPKGKG